MLLWVALYLIMGVLFGLFVLNIDREAESTIGRNPQLAFMLMVFGWPGFLIAAAYKAVHLSKREGKR